MKLRMPLGVIATILVTSCGQTSRPPSLAKLPTSATESHPCADADALRAEVPRLLTQGRLDRALWSLARGDALCPAGSALSATLRKQVQAEVESTREGGALLANAKAAGDRGDRVGAHRLRAQAAGAFEREVGATRAVAFAHERGMPHISADGSSLAIERPPTPGFDVEGGAVRAPPSSPLVVVDVVTGQERLALPNHRFLTFAKRGLVAINRSEGRAELWDILQGKRLWSWSAPIVEGNILAASTDHRWLLLQLSEHQVLVLDTESERERLLSLVPNTTGGWGGAVSDDGSYVVLGQGGGWSTPLRVLSLYEMGSGTAIANFSTEPKARIWTYTLSKDGLWLAIAREEEVQVYSIRERKVVSSVACGLPWDRRAAEAVFTEDSHQLWVSAEKKICIYDVTARSQRQIATPSPGKGFYSKVTPLTNGQLFAEETNDGHIRLFRSRDGKRMASGRLAGEVGDAVFLVDSKDSATAIVRVDSSKAARRDLSEPLQDYGPSPVVSPDGGWLVGPAASGLALIDTVGGTVTPLKGPDAEAFQFRGTSLFGHRNPTSDESFVDYGVWAFPSGRLRFAPENWLPLEQGVAGAHGFAALGATEHGFIEVGKGRHVSWSNSAGQAASEGAALRGVMQTVFLKGGGPIVLRHDYARNAIWIGSWAGETLIESVRGDGAVTLSEDGRIVAIAAEDGVEVWDLITKRWRGFAKASNPHDIVLSFDGERLAYSAGEKIVVWATAHFDRPPLLIPTVCEMPLCQSQIPESDYRTMRPQMFCGNQLLADFAVAGPGVMFDTTTGAGAGVALAVHPVDKPSHLCTRGMQQLNRLEHYLSDDGLSIASTNLASGADAWIQTFKFSYFTHLSLSPKGTRLIATAGDELVVLNTADGKLLLTLRTTENGEASVALAPDGRVEIFGDASQVRGRLSCHIGVRVFPFELCEERLLTPGLVAGISRE